MNLQLAIFGAALAVAGTAVAGDYGTFAPNSSRPKPLPSYQAPSLTPPTAPKRPAAPSPPDSGGFKPYEPYQGSSVYSRPKPATSGAKPCELSVYTNACGKR